MEMNIATWNLRGFNAPSRAQEALRLASDHSLSTLGLLETKVRQCNFNQITKGSFSFQKWEHNYSSDKSGRIIVGQDQTRYCLKKLRESNQVMHFKVKCLVSNCEFFRFVIYANNNLQERELLWKDLCDFSPVNTPQLVAGDFNNVLYSYERIGGDPVHPRETMPFFDCISSTGLMDLKSQGYFLHRTKEAALKITFGPRQTKL